MNPLHHQIAEQLYSATYSLKPIPHLTVTYPDLTVDDAYEIAKLVFDLKKSKTMATPTGKKIGLTSKVVQAHFGVYEPDFGFLTSDLEFKEGDLSPRLIQPKAEAEIAFVLKKDILSLDITAAAVPELIDYCQASIEVIDSRYENWKIKGIDTIADSASNGCYILGKDKVHPSKLDLGMMGVKVIRNGEIESTSAGAACLGHPYNALVWLAREMIKRESPLKAGELILSGAITSLVPFLYGDRIEAEFSGLGKVSCHYVKPN